MNTESDRQLDEALRRAFVPPDDATFAAMARHASAPVATTRHWPWVVLAAALLAVAVLLAWPGPRGPEGHDGSQLGALWAAAYTDAVDRGFDAGGMDGCCKRNLDLPRACRDRFACCLDVARGGAVKVLGEYDGRPTGGCMALMAKAGDEPVCVYVLPKARDPKVQLPRDSKLCLGRRELGDVVLYAVSKAPAPTALDSFMVP